MLKTVSTMIFLYIILVGLLLSSSSPAGLVATRPFSGISGSDTGRTLFQLLPPAHLESIAGTDDLLPRTRDLSGLPASSPPGSPLNPPSAPHPPNPSFSNDNNNPSSPFVATSSSSQLPAMFPGPSPLPPLPPLPTPLPSISPNLIVDNPLTGSNNLPPLQVDLPPPLQVGLPPLQVGLPPLQVDLPPLVELSPSSPQHIGLSSTIQSPLILSSSSPPLIIHTFITSPPALLPLLITTPPSPPTFTTTTTSPTTTISSTTVLPTPMTTPLPMNPPTMNPPTNTSPTMTPPIIARTSPTMNPPTITSPSMTPPIIARTSPTMNPQSVNQPTINPPTMTTFPAPPSSSFSPENRPVPASPSTPSSPGFTNETSVPGNITTSSPGVLTSNITTSSPGVLTSNFAPQQLSQLQLPSDHLPPQLPPQLPQQELVSPTPALSSTPGVPVGALLTNNNSSLSSGTQPNITSTAAAHNSSAANQSYNYVPSSGAAGSSMLPWPYMVAAVGGSAGAVLLLSGIMIMVCLRRRNRLRSSNKVVMAPLVNKVERSNSQCGYVPGGLCERIIVKGGSEELVLGCTTDNQRDGRSSTTSSNKYQHQTKQVAMQPFPLSSSSCTSDTLLLRGNYLFSDDCVISNKVNAITPSSHHKLPSVTRLLKNGCSPSSSLQAINHFNSNKSQTIIHYVLPRSLSNNTDPTGPPCLQGMPLQPQQAQKDQIDNQSTTIDQPFYPVDCTKSHESSLLAGSTASNHSLYCRPSTRPPQQLHCKNQISRASSSSKNEVDITSMHFRSDTGKDSIIASSALPDPFLNADSSIIMLHESEAAVLSAAPQHNEARPGQNNAGYQNGSGHQSIHITYPALQHAMTPPEHQHPPPNGNLQHQLYKQVQQPFSTSLHENSLNSPSLSVLSLELIENLSDAPRQCTASLNTIVTSPGVTRVVVKGLWKNRTQVCLHVILHEGGLQEGMLRAAKQKLLHTSTYRHPNVARVYAVCFGRKFSCCVREILSSAIPSYDVASDHCRTNASRLEPEQGSVIFSPPRDHSTTKFSIQRVLLLCLDVALALSHFHHIQMPGAFNIHDILENKEGTGKLCPFGYLFNDLEWLTGGQGRNNLTVCSSSRHDNASRTHQSDVYTFGIILLQLLNTITEPTAEEAAVGVVASPAPPIITKGHTLLGTTSAGSISSQHVVKTFAWRLATQCCDCDLAARPKLFQVIQRLTDLVHRS
ncbi:hypothetical protein CEUSTIGMA_g13531.t1 [Chlamydomonas eustigma]|uniref:Serine-threonine/tyrosine-protein kinase catalytic domain-containing protein n=1 Tax=Chlamydomonas eustigma TaxID=1157962 RepID=A0A250XST6_9CHLO|nr:hypothetical protein CEUSTIGMA_g13531.t1 [Chlamydomonas eustigma]|eukprot:GAX86118.1 hypothetical protein CEUSTIGMA_g13531.t1 [Chlamydomonas eustigma]